MVHLNSLHERYKDRAQFFMVYIKEAHPADKVPVQYQGVKQERFFGPTDSAAERAERAAMLKETFGLTMPVLVDEREQNVEGTYHSFPFRLVVIDPDGRVTLDEGVDLGVPGTGLDFSRIEAWMETHL